MPLPFSAPTALRALPLVLFALLGWLAHTGCSRPAPVAGVVHLDPRLAGGESSGDVLAARRTEVGAFSFADGALPAPWTAGAGAPLASRGGLALVSAPGALVPPRFVFPGPLRAEDVDLLEVELSSERPGRARVEWQRADDPGRPRLLDVHFERPGSQVLRFDLAAQDGWRGEVTELALVPNATGAEPVAVGGVRLFTTAFTKGPSPLSEGTLPGDPGHGAGDGGLLTLELETRRAWPNDLDVPLYALVRAPKGAVLSVDVAMDPSSRELSDPVHFAVDARRPGKAWRRIALRTLVPLDQPAETLWRPMHAPLSDLAAGPVELRFVCHVGGDGEDMGRIQERAPETARVFWGRPMLVPEVGPERLPNVLLVSLDTARADAFSPYAPERHTPFLGQLAKEGLVFDAAFAPSNSTQPSHASLLTGLAPLEHGVLDNFSLLAPEHLSLAETLRGRGYLTAGAVSQQFLGSTSGFAQGFDQFLEAAPNAWLDGAPTVRGVRRWLESWAEGAPRPWFLWVHLFDPHTPYTPNKAFLEHYLSSFQLELPRRAVEEPDMPVLDVLPPEMAFLQGVSNRAHAEFLYHVCAAYTDALVENIASTLSHLDQLGSTAFFVTADHGESLGERDNWFNHKGVFPEVQRIPLVISWPGLTSPGRVRTPVTLLDIVPTVSKVLGLPTRGGLSGVDLFALAAAPEERRAVWFEHSESWQAGVFDGRYYLVETLRAGLPYGLEVRRDADGRRVAHEQRLGTSSRFLYDLDSDPRGLVNLAGSEPERAAALAKALAEHRASLRRGAQRTRDTSAADRDQLGALGYR